MTRDLLQFIESHPALSHPLFIRLGSQKLSDGAPRSFLREMGAFCSASREGGCLAEVLRDFGMAAEAEHLDAIFKSEEGHGETYAMMAKRLLGSTHDSENWGEPAAVEPATRSVCRHFKFRERNDGESAARALGAMAALEIAAHRQIIPGEVNAFIDSGFYGLTLDDVPYLLEHAGEHGAEHDHEERILEVLSAAPRESLPSDMVLAGCEEFLELLGSFYDTLLWNLDSETASRAVTA